MLTKRQANKLRKLIEEHAEARSQHDWQQDQGYSGVAVNNAAKANADAIVALNQYINSITEKA